MMDLFCESGCNNRNRLEMSTTARSALLAVQDSHFDNTKEKPAALLQSH